jgi:DNA-binding LacI/PurR family transcriptional regulator
MAYMSTKRPTIVDIARHAGVSKSAVSFALNGQRGVSEETRRRILAAAAALGWQPSSAARVLTGGRVDVVGLVLARQAAMLAVEPHFMRLISGFEAALGAAEIGLLLQVVGEDLERELEVYRRWWGRRNVDGVFMADLRVADPRIGLLRELGMPAVVLGHPRSDLGVPAIWVDSGAAMTSVVELLARLGHRRIARVAGVATFMETLHRDEAFRAAAARTRRESAVSVDADFSAESAVRATRALLSGPDRPTAIVYDNDVMAVSGMGAARDLGFDVPRDLSIVAWDDSPLCQVPSPPLTALWRDVPGYGAAAAAKLRRLIAGGTEPSELFGGLTIVERGSTGPGPAS